MSTLKEGLFVSATIVKTDTALSDSVDNQLISPVIYNAQRKYILPVLGTDLYEKFNQDLITNNLITGNYETLLIKYIIPCLVQYTFAELLPVLRLRFVGSAVTIMNSEQSTGATYEDIKPIINQSIDLAEFLRQRLIDYLCNNTTLFPEYSTNTKDEISPTTNNYYPGLNIDGQPVKDNLQLKSVLSAMGLKGYK